MPFINLSKVFSYHNLKSLAASLLKIKEPLFLKKSEKRRDALSGKLLYNLAPNSLAVLFLLVAGMNTHLCSENGQGLLRQEVQKHGLIFEDWVRTEFFEGGKAEGYTAKWDIPAEQNLLFGKIPVNPKATKYGTPVGLGDALRQFEVNEPFLLIIGYWQQQAESKRFVKALALRVDPENWRSLWGAVTKADLELLDAVIKDRSKTPLEVRRAAMAMKNAHPFTTAVFTLNPKIDDLGQRRLQCSLPFQAVFEKLAPGVDPKPEDEPTLFGRALPEPFYSPPRYLKKPLQPETLDENKRSSRKKKPERKQTDGSQNRTAS